MIHPTRKERATSLLKGHFLLGTLRDSEITELLAYARLEHYVAGRKIFAKGSPGRSMMAILLGRVRISAPSPAGPEIVLTILNAGDVFGEIALIDGQDRTADATAIVDSDLLVLDHRDFMPFLERRADLCLLFLKLLCQRLRQTDQQVEETMFGRLEDRMAKTLVRLANGVTPRGRAVTLHISQQDLAGMVGTTRESVNKQLQIWQDAGILRLSKRVIEIPDIALVEVLAVSQI